MPGLVVAQTLKNHTCTMQFTRTIQNYQKAFRKKVEGMKVELKSVRSTNEALRKQVRRLKSPARVYLPGIGIGVVLGITAQPLWRWFKKHMQRGSRSQNAQTS